MNVELGSGRVRLRPVAPQDVTELRRILHTPQVHARWDNDDADPAWPFDYPEAVRFCVTVDGAVAGLIQYDEELEPAYKHASIDIFLDPALHGQRVGRTAVYLVAEYLVRERGHHRLVIDPAADNEAAIRCYASIGFRPVGIMREYERDVDGAGWHDGLLMDMLASELIAPA